MAVRGWGVITSLNSHQPVAQNINIHCHDKISSNLSCKFCVYIWHLNSVVVQCLALYILHCCCWAAVAVIITQATDSHLVAPTRQQDPLGGPSLGSFAVSLSPSCLSACPPVAAKLAVLRRRCANKTLQNCLHCGIKAV